MKKTGAIAGSHMNRNLTNYAIAIVAHLHDSQFSVGGLMVHGMAAIVCMTHRDKETGVVHDR
jgi:hypothetical protein